MTDDEAVAYNSQLGFKYFVANEAESLGETEGHSDTSERFMRTQESLFKLFK